MKALILAGGLGTRLKPFTDLIPKPLLPIGEKAILEIQIEQLKQNGFTDIYIATNYKSNYIESFLGDGKKYGINLKYSKEKKRLGTVGPITLLKNELDKENFLMMNGDILTKCNFNNFFKKSCEIESDLILGIKEYITPFRFGNITSEGQYVNKIEEKPLIKTNILAGIYVLKPNVFEYIPENEFFNMDQLINKMLSENRNVGKIDMTEYWLDVGVIDDYKEIEHKYKEHFEE